MILDTNILIAYLNGEEKTITTLNEWKQEGKSPLTSPIAKAEVLAYPPLAPADIITAKEFLSGLVSVPFSDELVESTAFIRKLYRLPLPDAAIAATALTLNVPLVTRDQQFRKIKEIVVIEI